MGVYRCVAENVAGSDSVEAFLYPVRLTLQHSLQLYNTHCVSTYVVARGWRGYLVVMTSDSQFDFRLSDCHARDVGKYQYTSQRTIWPCVIDSVTHGAR